MQVNVDWSNIRRKYPLDLGDTATSCLSNGRLHHGQLSPQACIDLSQYNAVIFLKENNKCQIGFRVMPWGWCFDLAGIAVEIEFATVRSYLDNHLQNSASTMQLTGGIFDTRNSECQKVMSATLNIGRKMTPIPISKVSSESGLT